jgi:hypothetical protein
VSAHTRCDECRAEHARQKLTVKIVGMSGEREYCSWACLLAVAGREAKDEAASKAAWYAKVNSAREVFPAQSPVDDPLASDGQMETPRERCEHASLFGRCDLPAAHNGNHGCSAHGYPRKVWL